MIKTHTLTPSSGPLPVGYCGSSQPSSDASDVDFGQKLEDSL